MEGEFRKIHPVASTLILGVIFVFSSSSGLTDEKSHVQDDYRSFLNSQMSHCMKKVIKPTKRSLPGPGGFVHCRTSIGKCIDDLLYCKNYAISNAVTENISLATVDIINFCGQIDIKWNPPVDRTSPYYMARVWNISLQTGYSINITALQFQLAFTEECALDHVMHFGLFSGSGAGVIQDSLWGRICGKRSEFYLYSENSAAQLAVYIESYAILVLDYSVMVAGKVRGLASAETDQYPLNLLTGERLDGRYLKIFTDKSYFWYLKCDIRGRIVISYQIEFKRSDIPFEMKIIDGPLVHGSPRYSHPALLEDTLFNIESKDLSGKKTSTGFMAVIVIHKSSHKDNNVPVVIEYKEDIPDKFEGYKIKKPVKDNGIIKIQSGHRAESILDITNAFGTWHLHFQAPENKYISILIAVNRWDTPEHREIGVESQHCAYSGFAAYNDTELLGNRTSLGPFCGKWWSSQDSWIKNQRLDWAHIFVTSAQNSINLMFYRYYDPDVNGKVTLNIIARTQDCPGRLVTCARPIGMKPLSPVEHIVSFQECMNIYIYLQQTSISECTVTVTPKDKRFIEVRDVKMSSKDQARRSYTHFNITKPLSLERRDCRQTIELATEETGEESLEPSRVKGFSTEKLVVKSEAKECFLSNMYARLFLSSTDCRHEILSAIDHFGKKSRKYSETCGRIELPSAVRDTEIMKFQLHNPDVDFYTLKWTTERCLLNVKPKIAVHVHDNSIPQEVTLHPKSTFTSSSRNDLILWNSGGNNVMLTVIMSGPGTRLNCPLLFKFSGNKKENVPAPKWNSTDDTCSFKSENRKETTLRIPINANNMTWRETEKYCQNKGGHLISAETEFLMLQIQEAAIKRSCEGIFKPLYSASMIYIGLHDLTKVNNYWWTSCKKPKYNKWRNPGRETATVSGVQADESSMLTDPLLKEIWNSNKKEPISNRKYRCSAMILLSPNMDPVWLKIPCDYRFVKATAVCTKAETCTRELPKQDPDGNDLRKHGPQWNKNITCAKGWVMNAKDYLCYQLIPFLPDFKKKNQHNYDEGTSKCEGINGTIARVSEASLPVISSLLVSMKVKPEYGSIWIQTEPSEMDQDVCYILQPTNNNQRRINKVQCSLQTVITSVLCTKDHQYQRQLPLEVLFKCLDGPFILKLHICDRKNDCKDGSDETYCPRPSVNEKDFQCPPLYYKCDNSTQCISWSKVCDQRKDCLNSSSDEILCPSFHPKLLYRCKNGQTIGPDKVCDTSYDCADGTDESDCDSFMDVQCDKKNFFQCEKHELIHADMVTVKTKVFGELIQNGMKDLILLGRCALLSTDMHPCDSFYDGCFKKSGICVYDRLPNDEPAYCQDNGHLRNCEDFVCPGKFKCEKSYCIPFQHLCDGTDDCPSGDDEIHCHESFCNNSFWCDGKCLSPENVCDGISHCLSGDDELMCDMSCPNNCECLGHAIDCSYRNITLIPDLLSHKLKALFLSHNNLNDSSIEKLGLCTQRELLILDLSFNEIENVNSETFFGKSSLLYAYLQSNLLTSIPEFCFSKLPHLQILEINHNLIHTIQQKGFYGLTMVVKLDLSAMKIKDIGQHAFGGMVSLKYLNMSLNQITYIGPNVFQDLINLTHLNLSGNSLKLIAPSAFQILTKLESLHTDDYKFCCAAPQVNACLPEPDVYSSCDDLMSSDVLRACIWLLGFFSLIGNIAVVCYRSWIEKPSVLSFLVHNLGVADFMMGIYLLIVAAADAYYSGVYYLHDSIWRSHFMCRIAGFLSMLSSEMSVYILVLITTDRVLTVGLGRNSFSETAAKVLTSTGWVVFIFLSLLPVTNISYFGIDEYIQHGVCFLFNLTEGKVSGWEYATAIFIGFNLFALIYLAVGYSFTFISVLTRTGITGDVEVQLARKLALVVLTDCVCWIPPITIGIISLKGQPIDPQVSMWIAVFVFPINSSLNPFLYTFSTYGKKPRDADDDSDNNGGVTQIDGNKDCNSVSDQDIGGYIGGAVGGTTNKTVRFVSVTKESGKTLGTEENDTMVNFDAIDQMMYPELVDYPIVRINSADSGIDAFCMESDLKSPAIERHNRSDANNADSAVKDTAF